jgi:hypothetical protein
MATTTNYGWTTPDDTALVKDGASAIRTLGSSVDTTTKNLNPETTLGDIAYRSSTANVKTRLGLGTAGQVLTVNSGANAPEWATISAGGMTLLSTTTLSGATVTVSGISGSYKNLYGVVYGVTNATANGNFFIKPNNSDIFDATGVSSNGATATATDYSNQSFRTAAAVVLRTNADNAFAFVINNYASTLGYKPAQWYGGFLQVGTDLMKINFTGYLKTNSAITSLVLSNSGGNLSTGTLLLYGVN